MSRAGCVGRAACVIALVCAAAPARALPPDQIYERVSPSVWLVKTYTADERLLASASAVVVAPGKAVTSCQVLAHARLVQLRRGHMIFEAKLEFPDVERDLCQLDVPGLGAPDSTPGTARRLRIGQRLYLVGFRRGNEQSLSEGLVSAVSETDSDKQRIQTTVPAAPGLLGAGLFDEEAHLVGIVTNSPKDAATTAFAVPADWLVALPARGRAALDARAKAPTPSVRAASAAGVAPGMPAQGTAWIYAFTEKVFSRKQIEVTVRALRVEGTIVEEAVTSTAPGSVEARRVTDTATTNFLVYPLNAGASMVELAPYLLAAGGGDAAIELKNPKGYPRGSPGLPGWVSVADVQGWEQISVAAGNFRAIRIDAKGHRSAAIGGRSVAAGRFTMSVWYAPDVKRIVRLEHRVWTADGLSPMLASNEVVELLAYRPPP